MLKPTASYRLTPLVTILLFSSLSYGQRDSVSNERIWEEKYPKRISTIPPLVLKKKQLIEMGENYIINPLKNGSIQIIDKVKYHFDFPKGKKKFTYYESINTTNTITGRVKFKTNNGKSHHLIFKIDIDVFLVYSDHYEYQVHYIAMKSSEKEDWVEFREYIKVLKN